MGHQAGFAGFLIATGLDNNTAAGNQRTMNIQAIGRPDGNDRIGTPCNQVPSQHTGRTQVEVHITGQGFQPACCGELEILRIDSSTGTGKIN